MSDKRFGKFGMLELPLGVQSVIDHPVQAYVKNPLGLRGGLGPELVTNGAFAADTDWTKGAQWTIPSPFGAAVYSDAANSTIQQIKTWGLSNGKTYQLSFEIADLTAGTAWLRAQVDQYAGGLSQYIADYAAYANGTYRLTFTFALTTCNAFGIRALSVQTGSSFKLKNVSIRQVL